MNATNYPLTLLYDGNCPVCNLEMDNLKARNSADLLRFVNITTPGFDPTPYKATVAEMNALIHAQRPDGSLVIGVEVFRLAYSAVGLGSYTRFTGWPVFKPLVDLAYKLFARNRYAASRIAMPFITWIAARRALKRSKACAAGHCELPIDPPDQALNSVRAELVEAAVGPSTSSGRTAESSKSRINISHSERNAS